MSIPRTTYGAKIGILSFLLLLFGLGANAAPSITSLSVSSGPVGTAVTITGTSFGSTQGSSTVAFNGTNATVTTWSGTSIAVTVPSTATTGNVVVTVSSVASNGKSFTVTPHIASLSITSGAVGASVTITGTTFGASQGTSTVKFNTTTATPTSWSATSIVVPVPTGATTGNVVVTAGTASNGVSFTVVAAPSITSLSVSSGPVGTAVTITGTGFNSTQGTGTVTFNGTSATVTTWSGTSIAVTVPSAATTGNVVVNASGVTSNAKSFTVTPHIASLSITSGAVGASVTITGTTFGASQGTSTVKFNTTTATPTSWSATSIVVPVPTGATTGNVVVTAGTASNGVSFTVVAAPSITSLSVSSGPVGTAVTITGTGFNSTQGTGTVTFNGTSATVTTWSGTSIAVTVPSAATTGNVVVNASGVASNGVNFTVTPHITSLSTTSGPVGTSVTITGTTFGSSQGTSTVAFNGTGATVTTWSPTSIAVAVPSAATTGNVVVTVSSQASNGVNFTVTPHITSLSPASGAVGASVTITGTTFGASQGTSTVKFNTTTATPTSWSATSIVVPVPTGATTGNVVVTAGTASNGVSFTVVAAPSITSLSVSSGPVGTAVTITGTGFNSTQGTGTVTFNGTGATVTTWSATSIAVTVPSAATTGNVVVNASGAASNGASFTVTPNITSLSTTSGAAGTSITVTGTAFGATQGTSTLTFNGTAATPTSWSATSIAATVPSGATSGNVVVTVSGQASNGLNFTVISAPTITTLSPVSAGVGTAVTITGTNFGSSQGSSTVTFNGVTSTPSSWSATSIVAPVPTGATTGPVLVTVSGLASNGVTFSLSSLPAGWSDGDIGPASVAGTAAYNSDVFTVTSTGAGVGFGNGNSTVTDGLHFVYQPLSGDGTITARVVSLSGGWAAEAGLMIRETLGANANNVFVTPLALSTPSIYYWDRSTTGGSEANPTSFSVAALPYWLRLVRSGSTFTAYTGTDGTNWTQMSSQTVSMAQNVYIGLATTGGNNGTQVANSTFDNVSVNAASAPGPVISSLSATTGPIGSQVVIYGSGFGSTQGTSFVTLSSAPVTINSWSATAVTVTIPTGAVSGPFRVTVGPSMNDSNTAVFTITTNPLPIGWLDLDIGPAGAAGTATYSGATFTLNSAGTGVGGVNGSSETVDGLHFVYQPMAGDGEIVARITSLVAGGWASQGGLMIRETLDSGATNMFLAVDAISSNTLYLYDRATTGTSENNPTSMNLPSTPFWLKVSRSGSTFAAYTSPDGENWSQLGSSIEITMAQNVYVGLACTGANNGASLTTSKFDYVSVTSTAAGAPVIGSLSATTGSVGTPVVLSGSGFGASQGSSVVTLNAVPVTVTSWSDTAISVTIPTGATSGYFVVSVAPSMNNSNAVLFEVTTTPLPNGWLDLDIGAVGVSGNATYSNGVFTISAGGYGVGGTPSGIGGPSDGFHYVYQALQGDGTIIARLVSEPGTTGLAGLLFRAAIGDTSPLNAYVTFFPQNSDVLFLDRTAEGASENIVGTSPTVSLPYWLKLVRTGNVFSAYLSADSANWVAVGTSQTIALPTNAFVGLAVSSHNTSVLATATFDNVSVSSTQNPAPVITGLSSTTGSVGSQVVVSGFGFGQSQSSSQVLLNDAPTTVNSWSDNSITITIPAGATSGPIVVSVGVAMNNSNAVQFTVTANPLPSGWFDQDVGTVSTAGSATYSSGTFTVKGAGLGVGGTGAGYGGPQDSFHFVYQPLAGSGTIIAHIATHPATDGQAGIMIRESLDSGALNAFFADFPQDGIPIGFARTSTGSGEQDELSANVAIPYWVKLTRSGASFTYFTSADGSTWTQAGSAVSIPMGQNVYIGLGVSGGLGNALQTATFDNVSLSFSGWGSSPTVTSLTPNTGATGASVTIAGSNFGSTQGTSSVTFNGTPATVCGTCWSSNSITVNVPAGATTGNVIVTVAGIASNGQTFGVFNPVISSISPVAAQVGATVVLTGSGFGTYQYASQIKFNGVTAAVSSWSDTSISALVPTGAASGPVNLTEQGVTSNSISFAVESLSVTSVSPSFGPAGSSVTITGTGFGATQTSSTVDFFGTPAVVTSWSDTQIVATVPVGANSGSVDVTVGSVLWYGPQFAMTRQIQLTDSQSHQTTYTSSLVGGLWMVTSIQGPGCSTCTERGNVSYTYDSMGHAVTHTDQNGNQSVYTYDANGNVLTVTAPVSPGHAVTTTYTYNSFGEVLTATDPLGHVTTNTYDANGNLLSVTTPAPGGGASASVTQLAYDTKGELTSVTDPLGNQTLIAYFPTGLIQTITDAQSNTTTYAYDSQGNRTSVTDANNKQTTLTYDAMNRLTKITYPDTTTTQIAYDIRGRRTSVTDQNGKVTSYTYDDADRMLTVTDAATNVTTYGYDTESNLTSIKDANNNTTSFTYDSFSRVTKTTFPSTFIETYGYDNIGNLTSKTDRKNQLITYTYDQLNRLTEKSYPDTTTVNYTYDDDGRLTQVTDPTGTYQFTFDNMGRLTGTTTSYAFLTARSFTTAYSYDTASNRTGFTDPESGSTTYAYDTLNRLQTLTPPSAFGTGSFGFTYDALSRRTQMTRPNGVTTNYAYDNLSHLTSVLHQLSGTSIDGATYTLDNDGNRTAKTDQRTALATSYGYDNIYQLLSATQGATTTESYAYDPVGNRTASMGVASYTTNSSNEVTANSNASFTYDLNGNETGKTDSTGTTTYAWDFENRLTSITLPGAGGTVSFKYDPFGRRIEKISSTATSIFAYDGNNLVDATNGSGAEVASYTQGSYIDEHLAMLRGTTVSYYEQDGLASTTSLTNSSGSIIQTYTYDSYGITTNSSGTLTNSFQYTGREFDSETGLYYYRSRFYVPSTGRFLNEDPIHFRAGVNFYRYVNNRPTMYDDPMGTCKRGFGSCTGSGPVAFALASTALDAIGIFPVAGNTAKAIQFGAGVGALAISVRGSLSEVATAGAGTGLAIADLAGQAGNIAVHGVEIVPILGNVLSAVSTLHDIFGPEGVIAAYKKCMSGAEE